MEEKKDSSTKVIVAMVMVAVLLFAFVIGKAVYMREEYLVRTLTTSVKDSTSEYDYPMITCSRDCAAVYYDSPVKWRGCFEYCKEGVNSGKEPQVFYDDMNAPKVIPKEMRKELEKETEKGAKNEKG